MEPIDPVSGPQQTVARPGRGTSDAGQAFEAMFLAEMLRHAGLAKGVAGPSGLAADRFAGFLVEAVARDMAATHSLGIGRLVADRLAALEGEA